MADHLTGVFCDYFIEDNLPVAKITANREVIESYSILPLISIILGDRLPEEIKEEIKENIIKLLSSERYLTQWGIATEAIDSPLYQNDAYWRGAIWAPTTLLIVDALEDCGKQELAMEIAFHLK
ncbi:trehalase family glycosidase [Gottfriedia sp. NPDC056225]|uniref:MGH1-like glycoside hydrolase domain-containing protein n=1 Tax=Gottfriedia sp. NPDC056225 TaxID=3345751 RepID=UPI0035DA11A0